MAVVVVLGAAVGVKHPNKWSIMTDREALNMRNKRQGLVIWFQHMKNVKQIKRYGHLIAVSRNLKYAVIYVDQETIDEKKSKLESLPFVSKVELSYKPAIRTEFENSKVDKEKDYEYKMGI